MLRIAVVTSHPIQYQAPWFRALSRAADLEVLFCHRQDDAGQGAAGFGEPFEWDVPLTDGYQSRWLRNVAAAPSVDCFSGCDTPEVSEVLAGGAFDACVVSGWYLKSYQQSIRACRRHGIPVLLRGDSQLVGPRGRAVRAAKYLPYRWMLRRADAHLYVGSRNRAYLEHYGVPAERLFFAPHFVDRQWFGGESRRAAVDGRMQALRAQLGLRAEVPVAMFAGKLIDKKRPADFVLAVSRLAAEGCRIAGVVVGSGPLESELRALAASEEAPVSFAGFRNQSEMPACYAMADVLVLPSDGRETWGLVVNEAMSCGVQAVLSDETGSAPDLSDDDLTGCIFPCGNVRALGEAVARTLQTRRTRPADVREALDAMMRRFSEEQAVAGTIDAARWALAERRARSGAALAGQGRP